MKISESVWQKYITNLRRMEERTSIEVSSCLKNVEEKVLTGELTRSEADKLVVEYAYTVVRRYSGGSAAAACEMYDAIALMSDKSLAQALPSDLPSYKDVAKAYYGARRKSKKLEAPGKAISELVKRSGVDTTMSNALRDGAEWAWVPNGDSCPVCLFLAAGGWKRASKKALKNGHAEHIHSNCDCTYAIRFDGNTTIDGYDPEALRTQFEAAEGDTYQEKINYLRSVNREKNKVTINARKRELYAENNEFKSVLDKYYEEATPKKGKYVAPENREYKNREKENMDLLYNTFGGDIEAPAERPGQKNPDYKWRGHYWEEKEPRASTKNAVDKNVREAIHQIKADPGGIVLDIGNSDMPKERVEAIIRERLHGSANFNCDVIVIRNREVEDVYRYKSIKK